MSKPQLVKVATGAPRASHRRTLTPRTPHSRAEEGIELERVEDAEYATEREEQAVPLLASSLSSSASTSPLRTAVQCVPLVLGLATAVFLLFLTFLSIQRPETLQRYIGAVAALPEEYAAECWRLNGGYVRTGAYWDAPTVGPPARDGRVCARTITYMLDGRVGLMADLALLAQVAALARERNSTFLVHDGYWNRGRWIDHFEDIRVTQPGPQPGCRAPNPKELVACPRTARHWIVNSRTARFHFGPAFENAYQDGYGREMNRLRPIFDSALTSFSKTIRPNKHTSRLIRSLREEFASKRGTLPYIGVHLRRGDRIATSWRQSGTPIPVDAYVAAAAQTRQRLSAGAHVYLATDAPEAEAEAASGGLDAFSLRRSSLRALASREAYVQARFARMGAAKRVRATRGMIVDFALLSGMWSEGDGPLATVCTVGSNVCKLSAVGLGWERAFGKMGADGNIVERDKGWVDIENEDHVSPQWEAFGLF